jgi:anti-anti-sigma factor
VSQTDDVEVTSGGVRHLQWSACRSTADVVVALRGELDLSSTEALSLLLGEVIDAQPVKVTIDLEKLCFLDSTGVRCLMDAARAAEAAGSRLVVRQARGMVMQVLEICGVDRILFDDSDGR